MQRWRPSLVRFGARLARVGDVLIPAVLAGMALYEIWVATFASPGFRGPRLIQTAGALLMIVSLGWRRPHPVAALACALAGAAVEWPWLRSSGQLSLEAFLVVLLVFYSVGAHAEPRRGLPALALTLVVIVAAEERARIARELHDVVAHSVSLIVVQVGAARGILDSEPDTARDTLRSAEQTGRQALAELRRMLGILREPEDGRGLAPQPGLEHIDALLDQTRRSGLLVELRTEGHPHPLAPGVDLAAYRIVQE